MKEVQNFHPERPGNHFQYVQKTLWHKGDGRCNHNGPCKGSRCKCVKNKTTCQGACKCGPSCVRQFPACSCKGPCDANCYCLVFNRECVPGKCFCTGCPNVFEGRTPPKLVVRASTITGAGKGLFADEDIENGTFLGEYEGKTCYSPKTRKCDAEDGTDVRVTLFQISADTFIDGSKGSSNVFYINCKDDVNAEFKYVQGTRRKVIALATKDIQKGSEIFASYGPKFRWELPKQLTKGQGRGRKITTPTHHGTKLAVGQYVFVKGTDGNDDVGGCSIKHNNEEERNLTWIGKIQKVYAENPPRVRVLWAYDPSTVGTAKVTDFGPYEILLSDHSDTVETDCLMGFATVEENCMNCKDAKNWCWNKRYRAGEGEIIESRPSKKRKAGEGKPSKICRVVHWVDDE